MWKFSVENLLDVSEEDENYKEEWNFPLVGPVGENLLSPSCVALSRTGEFLVSDPTSCFIVVYSKEGEFLSHFSTLPQTTFYLFANIEVYKPHDVAWLSTRLIVYTQPKGSCINVCNWKGQVSTCIQGKPLYEPYGIAVDMTDRVFVTDREKGRILCYNAEGKLLQTIGSFTSANCRLSRPHSILIDTSSNIIVSDIQRGKIAIKIFKRNGEHKETILTEICVSKENGQSVCIPEALAINEMGQIFLTDSKNGSIVRLTELQSSHDDDEEDEEEDSRTRYHLDTMKLTQTFSGMTIKPDTDQLVCVNQSDMKIKIFPWKQQTSNGDLHTQTTEVQD